MWAAQSERTYGGVTLFEYISVAISIVLALSAAQLLGNLREVFDPARRYWVHALWVIHVLLVHILLWWGFWAYRDVESWNLAFFALVLVNPGLLFVCSNALVLSQRGNGTSWEQHFFSVRKWFFVARGLIGMVSTLRSWLLLDIPILDPGRLPSLLMLIVCVVGVLSASRRVHGALVLISLVGVILGTVFLRFQPGWLAPSQ